MNTVCQIISYLLLNVVALAEIYFGRCLTNYDLHLSPDHKHSFGTSLLLKSPRNQSERSTR